MKPAWDELMTEFEDSVHVGVFDVDCESAGKSLCEKVGVTGYPAIKYGDPKKLQDYGVTAKRDFGVLKQFAEATLGPACSPKNIDACDAEDRLSLEHAMTLPLKDLDEQISRLAKEFDSKNKAYKKRRRKFDDKYNSFIEEYKDHRRNVKALHKAEAKLEGTAKASKSELQKLKDREQRFKQVEERFKDAKQVMDNEKDIFDKEKLALDAAMKASGLKQLRRVRSQGMKTEL